MKDGSDYFGALQIPGRVVRGCVQVQLEQE